MTDLQFHPLAEIFPLIEGQEFDDLVADIKARGLREPISTFDGMIVDGRNRYRACRAAEVKLEAGDIGELDPGTDLVAFVISANLRRRHMTNEERAKAADRLATLPRGSNQHASIEAPSQAEAAKKFDVTRTAVQRVRKVRSAGAPELVTAFEKGDIRASVAATVASLPIEKQQEIVAAGPEAVKDAAKAIRERETVDPVEAKVLVDDIVGGDAKPVEIVGILAGVMSKAASTPAEAFAALAPTIELWSDEDVREFARLLAEFRPVVVIHKQADPIKELINGDRLTCLECGHNKLKTLVRHLREQHNLSPEQYRAKWELPAHAPMNTLDHARVLSEKAANRGRRRSSESRSETARGKKHSPEAVAKRSAALRGRRRTPKSIAKGVAARVANRLAKLAAAEQPAA